MADNFQEFDEEGDDIRLPEELKGMVVSEVDFIRDSLQVFNLFAGQAFMALLGVMQGGDPLTPKPTETK